MEFVRRFAISPESIRPTRTEIARIDIGTGIITAIARQWAPGDSGPGGRCRLCPRCHARDNLCLIVVDVGVSRADAPLYDSHGDYVQEWVRPAPFSPDDV